VAGHFVPPSCTAREIALFPSATAYFPRYETAPLVRGDEAMREAHTLTAEAESSTVTRRHAAHGGLTCSRRDGNARVRRVHFLDRSPRPCPGTALRLDIRSGADTKGKEHPKCAGCYS